MKIRSKITLLSSFFLLLLVLAITGLAIYTIQKNTEENIASFREQAISQAKEELRDKVLMAYTQAITEYERMQIKEVVEDNFGSRIRNVVETADSLLKDYHDKVLNAEMTLEEAQAAAKKQIALLRYDDNVGYLWINDTGRPFPRMIMHPTIPSLNGTVLDDQKWNTASGVNANLFVSAVSLTGRQGAGFIDYEWPKPNKDGTLTAMQPKLSYVSLFKPWNWIIGSGVYIDDVKRESIQKVMQNAGLMRYDNGEGYFFILSNELPYPKTLMHPVIPALQDKVMNNPKWDNIAMNNSEHLFTALVKATDNSKGEGFVDYVWPKPTKDGLSEDLPKISFVKVFKPLNWIIGSGIYIDNIDVQVAEKRQQLKQQVNDLIRTIALAALAVFALSILATALFSKNLSKSIEELTDIAREISLGKALDDEIESTNRKDEVGQLARAIERLQTSVKMMMNRMKK